MVFGVKRVFKGLVGLNRLSGIGEFRGLMCLRGHKSFRRLCDLNGSWGCKGSRGFGGLKGSWSS